MAKKGQKFKLIDEELIKKIVKEKLYGKSYSYLSEKYHVPNGSIKTWVKKFRDKGSVKRNKKGKQKAYQNMTIEELRIEVDILKKFQAFLKRQHDKK